MKSNNFQYHEMSKQQFIEYLDVQSRENNQRICFDNWNKEGTYEYTLSQNIKFGEYSYHWYFDKHKIKGKSMASTNPYIIVHDITNQKMPPSVSGVVSGFIKLDKFTIGNGDLCKRHAKRIIKVIRMDIVKKALATGKTVPKAILKELKIEE